MAVVSRTDQPPREKVGACVAAVAEAWTIRAVVEPLVDRLDHVVLVTSDRLYPARGGQPVPDDGTRQIARDAGAHVIVDDWMWQHEQRQAGMDWLTRQGCRVCLMLDGDEVFLRSQLDQLRALFSRHTHQAWVSRMWDYYRLPCWRVTNPRAHQAPVAIDTRTVMCAGDIPIRGIAPKPGYPAPNVAELPGELWPRHYSWVRSNEGVELKLAKSEDRSTLRSTWMEHDWYGWTPGHQNFWPYYGDLHAGEYPAVVREDVPDEIRAALDVPGNGTEW